MQKWKFYGLIVALTTVLMFAPVSAWHADLTKSGPAVACPTCAYYTYTINVTTGDWGEYILRVTDTLPSGLTYISSTTTPGPGVTPTITGQTITWDFNNVQAHSWRNITLNVKPSGSLVSVSNKATSQVKACNAFNRDGICTSHGSSWEGLLNSNQVTTRFDTLLCTTTHNAPEFPSTVIPATFIIGFLGIVLFIRKTREN